MSTPGEVATTSLVTACLIYLPAALLAGVACQLVVDLVTGTIRGRYGLATFAVIGISGALLYYIARFHSTLILAVFVALALLALWFTLLSGDDDADDVPGNPNSRPTPSD